MQARRQGWVSRPVSKGRQRVKEVRAYLWVWCQAGPRLRKRVSVKRSYGVCDWGRTHIAVERKHTEWRDHHTNLMWHQRGTLTYPRFRTDGWVHCAHLAREESARWAPQRWALDDLSPLRMQAQRQGCADV